MDGEIVRGSAVKTLNRSKAVYGRVKGFKKRRGRAKADTTGRTQPGAPTQSLEVSLEDLDLIREDELAPEDRL